MADGEGKKSFLLRIDMRLWQELQTLASEDLRSVNAEIEFLLREALRERRGVASSVRAGKAEGRK